MGSICGVCEETCGLCEWVVKRNRTYRISDEEAQWILGCKRSDLHKYVRSGKIATHDRDWVNRLSFQDTILLKRELATDKIDTYQVQSDVIAMLDVLVQQRESDQQTIDEWLVELGLKESNSLFRYGRQVLLSMPPKTGWYVYHLCFTDGTSFYVGKGTRGRVYDHEADARRGVESLKCDTIRMMWDRGEKVIHRIVFVTPVESEAYTFERLEIAKYKSQLTNVDWGGPLSLEASRVMGFLVHVGYLNYEEIQVRTIAQPVVDKWRFLNSWAMSRTLLLMEVRELAREVRYRAAIECIDAEIDRIHYVTGNPKRVSP